MRAIALKAQQRLHGRYKLLIGRHKKPVVVVAALARELCGFVWAIACQVSAPEKAKLREPSPTKDTKESNLVLAARRVTLELKGYEVFLTRQNGGDALAVFLEPESKYGLHRFCDLQIPLRAGSCYPVLRIMAGGSGS